MSDGVDNEEGATESESDDSELEESGEHESDKDCEVIGGKETAIEHEEAGNTNGKRAATGGTQAVSRVGRLEVELLLSEVGKRQRE